LRIILAMLPCFVASVIFIERFERDYCYISPLSRNPVFDFSDFLGNIIAILFYLGVTFSSFLVAFSVQLLLHFAIFGSRKHVPRFIDFVDSTFYG